MNKCKAFHAEMVRLGGLSFNIRETISGARHEGQGRGPYSGEGGRRLSIAAERLLRVSGAARASAAAQETSC